MCGLAWDILSPWECLTGLSKDMDIYRRKCKFFDEPSVTSVISRVHQVIQSRNINLYELVMAYLNNRTLWY